MATTQKTKLTVPNLPTTVQGDGRYLMSLLKSFLEQSTAQINLANGFTAEEIEEGSDGAVQTPRDFRLTFTRLGGEFSWSHIRDIENLAYYELRTDTNYGSNMGLLERTIDRSSLIMPINPIGKVYLYAFNKDGEVSNPAELLYNKPRPDAPTDISITVNNEGTLISFSEIPSNCIGAHIYINDKQFTALDNIYLLTDNIQAEVIRIAFFDQFGDGESGYLYLVLPDVTGFLVERNGPELDFYWNPVNVYNVRYVVKVCSELSWEKGTELFRTATNDKNRQLYPNRGEYYLMVKAYDEHGNYSKNAAYWLMTTPTDISRNVILEYPQNETAYSGVKINVFYDPSVQGLTLNRDVKRGEYIFDIELDQEYRARNWLEYTAFTSRGGDLIWADANFTWAESMRQWAGILGNVDSANVRQEISYYIGTGADYLFFATLNGDLLTQDEREPLVAVNADDFQEGRWHQGLYVGNNTQLSYELAEKTPDAWDMFFNVKHTDDIEDTEIITLHNKETAAWLTLRYDTTLHAFVLSGSDGLQLICPYRKKAATTYFSFDISQSPTERALFVNDNSGKQTLFAFDKAEDIGPFNTLYCNVEIF